jgi:hypothetical protein
MRTHALAGDAVFAFSLPLERSIQRSFGSSCKPNAYTETTGADGVNGQGTRRGVSGAAALRSARMIDVERQLTHDR